MKFIQVVAAALLLVAVAVADQTIAIVDIQKIIDSSATGKRELQKLESSIDATKKSIDAKRADIEKKKSDLAKVSSTLSRSALEERTVAIDKAQRELDIAVQDARDDLGRKRQAALESIVPKIYEKAAALAKAKKFSLVLARDPRMVIYAVEGVDITHDVMAELDKQ